MSCPACDLAKQGEFTGAFQADCDGCKVRSVAAGREIFDAKKSGKMTPKYRARLIKVFGKDGWLKGHERVKRWINTKEL